MKVKSGKPRQANLRRAISTAYYALFHCLAKCCADALVGGPNADRSRGAWRQVYRALAHGQAKKSFGDNKILKRFPKDLEDFANTFVKMQAKRQQADYDPFITFYKSEVWQDVAECRDVIEKFQEQQMKDRRAFAAFALFKQPNR